MHVSRVRVQGRVCKARGGRACKGMRVHEGAWKRAGGGGGRPRIGGGSGPRTKGRACPRVPAMSLPRVCPHRALRPRLPRGTGPPRVGPGRTAPHRRCAFKAATGSARERIRAEGGAGRCGRTGTGDGERDGADGRVAEGPCGAGGECGAWGEGGRRHRGSALGGEGGGAAEGPLAVRYRRSVPGGERRLWGRARGVAGGALSGTAVPPGAVSPRPPRPPGPVPTCPVAAVPALPELWGRAKRREVRDGRCGPEPGPGTDGGVALRTAAVCGAAEPAVRVREGRGGAEGRGGGAAPRDPFGALNPYGCGWGGSGG